jgi:hypothetical protein
MLWPRSVPSNLGINGDQRSLRTSPRFGTFFTQHLSVSLANYGTVIVTGRLYERISSCKRRTAYTDSEAVLITCTQASVENETRPN